MSWTCAIHRGKAIPVADALSRAQLPTTADADDRMNSDVEVMVHAITNSLPMSETRRDELQRATAQDDESKALRNVIFSGWPDNIKAVPSLVGQFWTIREELHEADRMLFKGTKVIIPTIFRSEMLRRIHESHHGAEKSKERARAVVYWPNMDKENKDYVSKCTTCLRFRRSNTKTTQATGPARETVANDSCGHYDIQTARLSHGSGLLLQVREGTTLT
ncbi:uncharacterized protein K02A2.6-like [Corticium candelabrum]|uniref:uncharacterized protein K02A2.6-like n=1 Tax=Corticium candelabrum TaxID=121492 RepID=UPI002E270B61|nr:uncharacterized protein K02A2.6-like [Corticium candelabrum]